MSEIIWIDRLRNAGLDLFNILRGGNDSLHAIAREAGDDWWNHLRK